MTNPNFTLFLYRTGPERASNTLWPFSVDRPYSSEEEQIGHLELVKRYDNLSSQQLDNVAKMLRRQKGAQGDLLDRIDQILEISK